MKNTERSKRFCTYVCNIAALGVEVKHWYNAIYLDR